jgi:hypothetical protein
MGLGVLVSGRRVGGVVAEEAGVSEAVERLKQGGFGVLDEGLAALATLFFEFEMVQNGGQSAGLGDGGELGVRESGGGGFVNEMGDHRRGELRVCFVFEKQTGLYVKG